LAKEDHLSKLQKFSRIGFILSMVGSAIGLGNIWKFPTMMGQSGGASFLFVYLICLVAVGLPVLVLEMYMGNNSQLRPGAFLKKTSRFKIFQHLPFATNLLILSFYAVIGAWVTMALVISVKDLLIGTQTLDYSTLIQNPVLLALTSIAVVFATAGICIRGVKKGIELLNMITMPLLLIIMLILVGYCVQSGFIGAGIAYMFNFGEINITAGLISTALGHAFFTLSLGSGIVWTYGSLLAKEGKNPLKTTVGHSIIIALSDTGFALLMGVIIFSMVFGANLEVAAGPGLIFAVLPKVFSSIPGGAIIEAAFFFLVLCCCLTSSVSMFEVMMSKQAAKTNWKLAGWISAMSMLTVGSLSAPTLFTWFGMTPFGLFDDITTRVFMPLFGILVVLVGVPSIFPMFKKKTDTPLAIETE
jgi:neurotransmitter:Na+ symporter, NSS family